MAFFGSRMETTVETDRLHMNSMRQERLSFAPMTCLEDLSALKNVIE